MLYEQGLVQAAAPEPLSFSAVLTFHDAVELFLITGGEHLGATVKDKGRFPDRFAEALAPAVCANGVSLQGLYGIRRLTDLRNGFKHSAGFPGTEALQRAKLDTIDFLTVNTPLIFGLTWDDIDLASSVPQFDTREQVRRAGRFFDAGDLLSAMGTLADAFEQLLEKKMNDVTAPRGLSVFSFGRALSRHGLRQDQVRRILDQPDMNGRRGLPARPTETLSREITETRDVTRAMQQGLRLLALGFNLDEYQQFIDLTPTVGRTYGQSEPSFHAEDGYAPNREEFELCRQFLISAALRLADIDRGRTTPSWR